MSSTSDAAFPMAPDPAPSSPYQNSVFESDEDTAPDDDPIYPLEAEVSDVEYDEDFGNHDGSVEFNAKVIEELKSANLLTHDEKPSKLCRYCANITYEAMCSPERCQHTPNVWTLLQSAEECELCALVVEEVTASGLGLDPEDSEPESDRRGGFETFFLYLGIEKDEPRPVRVRLARSSYSGMTFEMDKGTDEDEWMRWHQLGSLQAFTDSSRSFPSLSSTAKKGLLLTLAGKHVQLSDGALPLRLPLTEQPSLAVLSVLVREWVASCQQSHIRCNPPCPEDAIPRLPTRVLDLRDVKAKATVRLWPTQGSRAQYIALSHCWGGKQPVKTETANLSQRIEGFPYTDLPSLFRDAVDTALAIGIDYLWIDSLCIIQDDKEDWAFEAARMADVYMNSYLTIAASAAPNSSGRLLGPRTPAPKAVRLPQRAHDGAEEEHWSLFVDDRRQRSFVQDAHLSPLNGRAWVLQERLLSPRTLHFTGTQLYWECWADVKHENLQLDRTSYHKSRIFPGSLSPRKAGKTSDLSDYLEQWLEVVETYTGCKLTFASDKLVAVSGIVDRIRAGNANPFYKGVFYDGDLHCQLLWMVDDNSRSTFLSETGAPSWSWASRDGKVHFAHKVPQLLAPHRSTCVAWRQDSEDELLDLRADLHTLDEKVLVGELRKKRRNEFRRKQESVFKNILRGDGDIRFRFIHQDSSMLPEDNDGDQEDARSDTSDFVPHFTGYEDDSDFEDDDTVAGVLLDHETGDEPSFNSIFWVLVGHVSMGKRNEYYCLLVQEREESKYSDVTIV
ncbi:hypothetical protein SLS55_006473 [Diplodia seriata]|uniref:Heterokaryon incompatibility domain-containing protein n=1 Tax=Diplodia seriata TaxID=420778 RepID=A0ABR3CEC3_9PEZI